MANPFGDPDQAPVEDVGNPFCEAKVDSVEETSNPFIVPNASPVEESNPFENTAAEDNPVGNSNAGSLQDGSNPFGNSNPDPKKDSAGSMQDGSNPFGNSDPDTKKDAVFLEDALARCNAEIEALQSRAKALPGDVSERGAWAAQVREKALDLASKLNELAADAMESAASDVPGSMDVYTKVNLSLENVATCHKLVEKETTLAAYSPSLEQLQSQARSPPVDFSGRTEWVTAIRQEASDLAQQLEELGSDAKGSEAMADFISKVQCAVETCTNCEKSVDDALKMWAAEKVTTLATYTAELGELQSRAQLPPEISDLDSWLKSMKEECTQLVARIEELAARAKDAASMKEPGAMDLHSKANATLEKCAECRTMVDVAVWTVIFASYKAEVDHLNSQAQLPPAADSERDSWAIQMREGVSKVSKKLDVLATDVSDNTAFSDIQIKVNLALKMCANCLELVTLAEKEAIFTTYSSEVDQLQSQALTPPPGDSEHEAWAAQVRDKSLDLSVKLDALAADVRDAAAMSDFCTKVNGALEKCRSCHDMANKALERVTTAESKPNVAAAAGADSNVAENGEAADASPSQPNAGRVRTLLRSISSAVDAIYSQRSQDEQAMSNVTEGLQKMYREKLLPIEKDHLYHHFYAPELTDADFAAAPMVLLLGQYSTGKSTFIKHILGRDYPGLRIGPEPTTDKFVAVMNGDKDQVIPGYAVSVDPSMPFTQLGRFGNSFLSRFECSKCDSPVLEGVTLIDTPGVLAGEKQRINRGYDFEAVIKWFAERVDMILLLFDPSKLDISDEYKRVILALKGNEQKVRVILNKADRVTTSQLMRVYGALMWSLGKVIDTPEVSRVYSGSFWDEPLVNDDMRKLFESEQNDLYTMLAQLPRNAAVAKLSDLAKRARLAKVHAYILDTLYDHMPMLFGREQAQADMLEDLPSIYQEVMKKWGVPAGDFPHPQWMKDQLKGFDFSTFNRVDKKKVEALDVMLAKDVPEVLNRIPREQESIAEASLAQVSDHPTPFAVMKVGGATETSAYQSQWSAPPDPEAVRDEFEALGPNAAGKISGHQAKGRMVESKLPSTVLHKVWTLADVDKDGALTLYEYALACHFIKMKLEGVDLPSSLPETMRGA